MTSPSVTESTAALRQRIADGLERARRRSIALTTDVLDTPQLTAQHSPIMSPLVWDLAHVGNQEELWLVRDAGRLEPVRCDIDDLYDAFKHPRSDRPALPLLDPAESRAYIGTVRNKVLDLLDSLPFEGRRLTEDGFVFGMIVQHEQQHDETMLATHQLRSGEPVLAGVPTPRPAAGLDLPPEVLVPAGEFAMGTSMEPWALDNERPAHRVDLPAYWIDTTPVTNAAYTAFIEAGGYDDPRWWSADGWAHRQRAGLVAPQSWERIGPDWCRTRFGRTEPVPPGEPVQHVCWYEADAYARWAGRRLPTEAEWEKAARHDPATGRSRRYPWGDDEPAGQANLGGDHLRPAPVGAYPAGASAYGVQQLIGDVWEWTASDFVGYPGFEAYPYREYSEVFFGTGEYRVLRGGSWATDPAACRATFRNWDYPIRRQIFAGFRCARDARPDEG
jgi:iron(II)-dependent oxidoreductase